MWAYSSVTQGRFYYKNQFKEKKYIIITIIERNDDEHDTVGDIFNQQQVNGSRFEMGQEVKLRLAEVLPRDRIYGVILFKLN